MAQATVSAKAARDTTNGGNGKNGDGNGKQKVQRIVPFIRASALRRESMDDESRSLGASVVDLGSHDVPAQGYLRSVVFHVTGTGGAAGAATVAASADAPFNVIRDIAFQEPNGSTIAQFNTGYDLYLAHKWGGYRGHNDPKTSPNFTDVDADGNFEFFLRLPLELSERDALGSLPNQNSGSNFKLRYSLSADSTLFDTAPDTLPSVRIRTYIEAWEQPPPEAAGMANQTTPPAVNTTQYWMPQSYPINAGEQSPRLNRVGLFVRNLVFTMRDSSGARIDDWPDPFTLMLDARPKDVVSKAAWRQTMYERFGYSGTLDDPGAQDTGVWVYDFTHEFDGTAGHENRDLWLPTLMSTRLEPEGNYPTAGTLHVMTNDVSTAGVVFM